MTIKLPIPNALIGALQSFRAKGAHADSWQGQRDLEVVYEYIRKYGEACAAAEREACALVAEDCLAEGGRYPIGVVVGAAIRARSKP
jgi:hypothetical protein